MQTNLNKNIKQIIKIGFIFSFAFLSFANINLSFDGSLSFSPSVAYANDGGDGGDGGGNYYVPPTPAPTCNNGATNYPACNNNVCTNGATNWPSCNNNVCTNGATNYPSCNNICTNGYSNYPTCGPTSCTNGATNFPSCNNNVCTNGATNFPSCNNNVCTNGATNFPSCNACPSGQSLQNGQCATIILPTATISTNPNVITIGNTSTLSWSSTNATYCVLGSGETVGISGSRTVSPTADISYSIICYNAQGQSNTAYASIKVNPIQTCTNGATNYPSCNNICTNGYSNYPTCGPTSCTNGATNFPACNNNYCSNGTTNFPSCNVCPSGQYLVNNVCTYQNNLPTVSIYPSSYSINSGSNVTLTWNSANATYCTASPWPFSGSKNVSGSEVVNLNYTTTFTITCFNSQGQSAQAQTTVSVNTITYVYCNGVQYPAGTVCPNTNYLGVSTTGANPLQTTATIFGYVNPNNTYATTWFEYGTNSYNLIYATNRQAIYNAGQTSANLTGLTCGTTYYYRAAAQNNSETKYGSIQSFVTSSCNTNTYTEATIITRPATLVSSYQGQLNGAYVSGNYGSRSCSVYFDYGTSYSLGKRTSSQNLYTSSGVNYFSSAVYSLSPNTRYYFRAVSNCNGNISYGSILSFVTPSTYVKTTYVHKPITKVVQKETICNCSTNDTVSTTGITNASYMSILVERLEAGAQKGGTANYQVVYKNLSSTTLQNVAFRVLLPEELTIKSASTGQYEIGASTLTLSIPSLSPLEEGRVTITTNVSNDSQIGKQIVVNAYANYSVPNIVKNGSLYQDEVSAYVISTIVESNQIQNQNTNTTTSTSIFGENFIEWIILIILVLLFILAIIYLFTASKRRNA